MLYYLPHMRRFSQGVVEYCALVSMQMAQTARGHHFNTELPVLASVPNRGLSSSALKEMFRNNGFIPVHQTPGGVAVAPAYTAPQLLAALRRFGPLIASAHVRVTRAAYGHVGIIFGVDTQHNVVIIKDPNQTIPALGVTDPFSDATVVAIAAFNGLLAHRQLGDYHLVGKPSTGIEVASLQNPLYVMQGNMGRVMERGRSREI